MPKPSLERSIRTSATMPANLLDRASFLRSSGGQPTEARKHSRICRTSSLAMASMSYRNAALTFCDSLISEQAHFIQYVCCRKTRKLQLPTMAGSALILEIGNMCSSPTSRRILNLGLVVGGQRERL